MFARLANSQFASMSLIAMVGVAATWPTWPDLVALWLGSNTYSHGLFVLAVTAVWFVRVASCAPPRSGRISKFAWLAFASAAIVWLVAYGANSAIGQEVAAPVLIWLAFWAVHGWSSARPLLGPLAFFYVSIPIWDLLIPGLQALSVLIVEAALSMLSIPVSIEGVLVHIPAGSFEVAEGCSGLRYLLVTLAIAPLLVAVNRISLPQAALLMVAATILSIIGNWIRILTIVIAGHLTSMQHYLITREHVTLGWLIFGIVMAVIVFLTSRLASRGIKEEDSPLPKPRDGYAFAPHATALAIVGFSLVPAALMYQSALPVGRTSTTELPRLSGEWVGPLEVGSAWTPYFSGATVSDQGRYVSNSKSIEFFFAEYDSQEPGRELTSYSNRLMSNNWIRVKQYELSSAGYPERIRVGQLRVPGGDFWLVGYVYEVGPIRTGSAVVAQIAYGFLSWWRPTQARLLAAALPCSLVCQEAEATLASFWAALRSAQLATASPGRATTGTL